MAQTLDIIKEKWQNLHSRNELLMEYCKNLKTTENLKLWCTGKTARGYSNNSARESHSAKTPVVWPHGKNANWLNSTQCTTCTIHRKQKEKEDNVNNINKDIIRFGLNMRGAMDLTATKKWRWFIYQELNMRVINIEFERLRSRAHSVHLQKLFILTWKLTMHHGTNQCSRSNRNWNYSSNTNPNRNFRLQDVDFSIWTVKIWYHLIKKEIIYRPKLLLRHEKLIMQHDILNVKTLRIEVKIY